MKEKREKLTKYLVIVLTALFAVLGLSSSVYAKDGDEEGYEVTVTLYQRLNGEDNETEWIEDVDDNGYVYINLASFTNMTATGFGTKLVRAVYDGKDVTKKTEIDEKLTKNKNLTIYVDTLYENTYNFFNVDGKLINQKKEVVNVAESTSYKIKEFSNEDAGLDKDQSKYIRVYGYGMVDSTDPIVKPDPKKDKIYKTGDTVELSYAKNFNVAYEYAENINIDYEFNGAYLSPKSYPSSKWQTDLNSVATFEKKPFSVKLGEINGVDIFTENDFYVEPLSYEGYKFAGWKELSTGKVYENGSSYELTPVEEILLENKESTVIKFVAQWEEEKEPEPEKTDYKNEWVDGKWYNADGTQTYKGTMKWKNNNKGWWIEDSEGWYPKSEWQKIDGKWYFFCADGYMDYSEYRDGCWLGDDGAWVVQYYGGTWKKDSKGWWYEDASGWYPKDQSVWIDGTKYKFEKTGYWDGK